MLGSLLMANSRAPKTKTTPDSLRGSLRLLSVLRILISYCGNRRLRPLGQIILTGSEEGDRTTPLGSAIYSISEYTALWNIMCTICNAPDTKYTLRMVSAQRSEYPVPPPWGLPPRHCRPTIPSREARCTCGTAGSRPRSRGSEGASRKGGAPRPQSIRIGRLGGTFDASGRVFLEMGFHTDKRKASYEMVSRVARICFWLMARFMA